MISGFCWPQSGVAKDKISLFCRSTETNVRAEVIRQGLKDELVWSTDRLRADTKSETDGVNQHGCDWDLGTELSIQSDWPSGFYLVRFETAQSETAEAYFVVRSQKPLDAILVLSTSTWAAYNNWGGPSFYTGSHVSSFERPLPRGFLAKEDLHRFRIARVADWSRSDRQDYKNLGYSTWCMAAGWANWELLFVRWAERKGITMGYATSSDLDASGELLEGYPAYVSVGHDEYWSKGMRDAVETYVDEGGNAAFFSGNTAFWQARFEDSYKKLVSYKTSIKEDPYFDEPSAPLLSTMWSDPLVGRPENQMTGVSFSRGGYARMQNSPRGDGGYRVMDPEHWIFSGLDLKKGDSLGSEGVVVGYECDGCVFVEDESGVRVTGEDGTPLDFSVMAAAPARLWETQDGPDALDENYIGELNWVAERIGGVDNEETRGLFDHGHAVMGIFSRKKGSVFTTGCTDWAYGLDTKDVNQVTKNVMERFILGK